MNTFTFGKYKGRSIMSVLNENPAYVEWCVNNIKWLKLDNTEQKRLNEITKAVNIVYYQYPYSFPRGKGASKILYERAFEYLENKDAFVLKYKKDYSNVNCLESMAHSLFKEFDRMSDSEKEEMNEIFGPNPMF